MITKNYIKMCEQAEEIQKLKKGKNQFSNQDFVAYNFGEGLKVYVCNEISKYWTFQDLTWLFTQEQLQEMVDRDWYEVFCKFLWWHSDDELNAKEFASTFNSMNEVWLAFVMKEKYHKIWTGEKWEAVK